MVRRIPVKEHLASFLEFVKSKYSIRYDRDNDYVTITIRQRSTSYYIPTFIIIADYNLSETGKKQRMMDDEFDEAKVWLAHNTLDKLALLNEIFIPYDEQKKELEAIKLREELKIRDSNILIE